MNNINKFFIVTPLSFEELALLELKEKWNLYFSEIPLQYELKTGGIEVTIPLIQGLYLNYLLKIPSKILLRIDEFKCKDGPKLFQKIAKIKWSDYLMGKNFFVKSESISSRLFDDRKINKATTDGINLFLDSNPIKKKFIELHAKIVTPPEIYIRIENDHCLVSINTSGELLYKRGNKSLTGNAPIRENLGAALFYLLKNKFNRQIENIIDPMCGSGTLLKESSEFYHLTKSREFAFYHFPLYLNLKNKMELIEKDVSAPLNVWGFDLDDSVIKQAISNCANIKNSFFSKNDIFHPNDKIKKADLVLINPPYGIRVDSNQEINSLFFTNIVKSVFMNFSPTLLGMIVPSEYQLNLPVGVRIVHKLKFKNGGINVTYYVLESSK